MQRGWLKDPDTGAPPELGFAGCIDFLDETCGLRGWIVNLGRFGDTPHLEVWCGARLLSQGTSHGERPDIDSALGASGHFGFLIAWDSFDLGEVYAAEEEAPEAPIFIACPQAGQIVPRIGEIIAVKDLAARLAAAASAAPLEPGPMTACSGGSSLASAATRDQGGTRTKARTSMTPNTW